MTEPAAIVTPADVVRAQRMVDQLVEQLQARRGDIARWRGYYDGSAQRLKFASPEYKAYFGEQYAGFRDNWCAPVVDVLAEKLTVAGIKLPDQDGAPSKVGDRQFAETWAMSDAEGQSSMAFTESAIARRSFALVWDDGSGDGAPEITFEVPDQVIVGYEPGSHRKRKAALKAWIDDTTEYATLYTPEWIWKWSRPRPRETDQSGKTSSGLFIVDSWRSKLERAWVPRMPEVTADDNWPIRNPLGKVPIVELPNRPRLHSDPISEVEGAAAMQDAVNAMWAYLFTQADYTGLPQRLILGALPPSLPVLDADGKPTGARKPVDLDEWMRRANRARVVALEGKDAKVAQWDAADLTQLTGVITFAVGHIAAQSRTPVHYFVVDKIANVSGDTLTALGQAHISKVRERSTYHSTGVRDIAELQYLVRGDLGKARAARMATVVCNPFEVLAPGAVGDRALKGKQAGMSRQWVASQFITDPVELADEVARQAREEAERAAAEEFGPKLADDSDETADDVDDPELDPAAV